MKIQMTMMTNKSFVVIWMKLKLLSPRMIVVLWFGVQWRFHQDKTSKSCFRGGKKDTLANVSNWHHMQSCKKVKSMLMADTLTTNMPDMMSWVAAKEFTKRREIPWWS
jgi:hypothetical protein